MDIFNDNARKIYRQFGDEKVVAGIKNPDLKITFINLPALVLIVLLVLILFLNLDILSMLNDSARNAILIIGIILFALAILSFLKGSYKAYYEDNNLIFENKLGDKKVFDISKYPRIYIRHRIYQRYNRITEMHEDAERYDLHLEQNDTNIVFGMQNKKTRMLLDNLETKERQEVDENIWNLSVNDRENTFLKYIAFLNNKQKIIGIRDTSKNMKISKGTSIIFKFLICVFIICAVSVIALIINGVFNIAILVALLLPTLLFVLKEEKKEVYLEISYPSENIIKIDKHTFNIKNDVKMHLYAYQLLESEAKYDYKLIISDNANSYGININSAKTEEICAIIDNLIFE